MLTPGRNPLLPGTSTPLTLANLAADPGAEAAATMLYAKAVAGVSHAFIELSDGTVIDLTPSGSADAPGNANYLVDTAAANVNLPNQRPIQALTTALAFTSTIATGGTVFSWATGAGNATIAGGDYSYTSGAGGAAAAAVAGGRGGNWTATLGNGGAATGGAAAAGDGGGFTWTAGNGGAAVGAGVGTAGIGGKWQITAGVGGVGTAGLAGGQGGAIILATGVGGATGGLGAGADGTFTLQTGSTTRYSITGAGAHSFTAAGWAVSASAAVTIDSTGGTLTFGGGANNQAIGLGTGGTRTITIGSANGASATSIVAGTGASSWAVAATGTLGLGNNATDHSTTLGSITGVSLTTVQGGTSGVALTSDVNSASAVIIQNQTFTPGATHVVAKIFPTWTAENFAHTALSVQATQNGANTQSLTGVNVTMVKATGATTLANSTAINIAAPTIAGLVTNVMGLVVQDQGGGGAGGGTVGVDIASQTLGAGTFARAMRIQGQGVNAGSIQFDLPNSRKFLYSSGATTMVWSDNGDAGGFLFTFAGAAGTQAIAANGANSALTVDANGTGSASFGAVASAHATTIGTTNTTASLALNAGTGNLAIAAPQATYTQAVSTSGSPVALTLTGAAHTGLAASAEASDVNLNLARTVQFTVGALSVQRAVLVQAPTYGFTAGSIVTSAVTMQVLGPPLAGTNATLTNAVGFGVGSAAAGNAITAGTTNAYGINVAQIQIAAGNADNQNVIAGIRVATSGTSLGSVTATLTSLNSVRLEQITYTSTTNVRTVTNPATLYIDGAPTNTDTRVSFSNGPYAAQIAGTTTLTQLATSTPSAIDVPAYTTTLAATTHVTSVGPAGIRIGTITVAQTGGAVTVDTAAALYIAAAPAAGSSVTLTSSYALWVDSGLTRLDGGVAFAASGQTTLSNYTEGTFAPTVTLVGGAGNTVPVYSTNTGRYTQIGNRVFVDVYLTGDGGAEGAGTGQINIALPVAANASNPTSYFWAGYLQNGGGTPAEEEVLGQIVGGGTTIALIYFNAIGTTLPVSGADQSSTTRTIRIKFFYEV